MKNESEVRYRLLVRSIPKREERGREGGREEEREGGRREGESRRATRSTLLKIFSLLNFFFVNVETEPDLCLPCSPALSG